MAEPLDERALSALITDARTANAWQPRAVDDALLHRLYELVRLGPTSANCSPARFVFVRSAEGKARLALALSSGNREKTRTAPVTVIVAHDANFHDALPRLFPHADAKAWFTSSTAHAAETAFRNGCLQSGYLILMARALGLDVGPMSGFDRARVDQAFFADTHWHADLLINLGYADPSKTFERLPRLSFEEACRLA